MLSFYGIYCFFNPKNHVDPQHRYSNESERTSWDIYDDFKLKNTTFGLYVYTKICQRFKGWGSSHMYGRIPEQLKKKWAINLRYQHIL